MKWQPIETAPRDGTHILIRYYKGGKNSRTHVTGVHVVTEGYFAPKFIPSWAEQSETYFQGNEWRDYLDRLIVQEHSKVKKNIPTHWMPLPPDP